MKGSAILIVGLLCLLPVFTEFDFRLYDCLQKELCFEKILNNKFSHHFTPIRMDTYRITFYRDENIASMGLSLDSPESQCILTTGNEELWAASLICSTWYSERIIGKTLQKFKTRQVIYLNCQGDQMSRPVEDVLQTSCHCYDVEIQDSILNDSTEVIPLYRCNNNTLILTGDYLKEQDNVQAILLENTPLISVSAHAFDGMSSLTFASFVNNLFGTNDLPTGLFCNNAQLEVLQLEGRNFKEFPSHLFKCTFAQCLPELKTVVIRNTNIITLPEELFGCAKNITKLFLSHNKISNVSVLRMQQLDHLNSLILSYNAIHHLEPFAFGNFSQLDVLDLSYNQLTCMNNSWFFGLSKLRLLYLDNNIISLLEGSIHKLPLRGLSLHHNSLDILPVNILNGSKLLVFLELQGNQLTDLNRGSLNDLISVGALNLSMNQISNFDSLKQAFEKPVFSLFSLLLSENRITEIDQYALSLFPGLVTLYLNDNLIQYIHPQAFVAAQNLILLRLDSNQITQLMPNLFVYLSYLGYLNLANNSISDLHNGVFAGLTSLVSLSLSQNNINIITNDSFQDLQQLHSLLLSGNQIEKIQKNAFPANLTVLDISRNQVSSLPCLEYENKLTILNTAWNNVSILQTPDMCNFENLEILALFYNNMKFIEPGALKRAISVQRLYLSNNILDLNFSVNYFKGLRPIDVYLNYNRIKSLDNLFYHLPLAGAKEIHLKGNPIIHVPSQPDEFPIVVEMLDLAECNITDLDQDAFAQMISIRHINLTGNLISVFPNLKLSSLAVSIELFDNPIECSCRMTWMKDTDIYDINFCINLLNQSNIILSNFPLEYFVCPTDILCDNELCECFSKALSSSPTIVNCSQKHSATFPRILASTAQHLYLHGNNYDQIQLLKAFPGANFQTKVLTLNACNTKKLALNAFQHFKFLEELYLHDNKLESMPSGLFTPLKLLRILTLHKNHLLHLEDQFLSSNQLIVDLRLNNNSLAELSEDTRTVLANLPHLQTLTLFSNPWECKCDNRSWKSWLLDMEDKLENHYGILCAKGTAVLATPDANFLCPNETYVSSDVRAFALTTGLAVILPLAVIIVMATAFYHRHMLAVLVFSVFGRRLSKRQDAEGCDYDVMLVYNFGYVDHNADLDDAVWHIYGWLNTKFKVMLPDKDIDMGTNWATEMCRAMSLSKKIVIILSVNLIEQNETMFIFDKCYHMTMERHSSDLILILDNKQTAKYMKGGDMSDPRLKAYLQTNNFLILGERHFYQRLLYLLPELGAVDHGIDENIVDRRQGETLF